MKAKLISLFGIIYIIVTLSLYVSGAPTGPTIQNGTSERNTNEADSSTGTPIEAWAGNATSLTLNSSVITDRWQGFYGNVTGTIILDDASGYSLYNWPLTSAEGEIYAVNSSTTPNWDNLICFNFTGMPADYNMTLGDLQGGLGMTSTEPDNVNNTFNMSFTGSFTIGSTNTIDRDSGCSAVSLYVSDAHDEVKFNETILMTNASDDTIVYVSILEQDATGFSGASLDFQMIVGDDGSDTATTPYWFYMELS